MDDKVYKELVAGGWVAVTEDGLWLNIFGDYEPCFALKSQLIDAISAAREDEAKTPNVKRIATGQYIYYPKSDGRYSYDGYQIIRLTKTNIDECREIYNFQIEDEDSR